MHTSLSPLVRGNSLSRSFSLSAPQQGIQGLDDLLKRALADGVAEGHHARTALLRPPPPSRGHGVMTAMMQQQIKGIDYDVRHLLTSTLVSKATQAVKTVLGA